MSKHVLYIGQAIDPLDKYDLSERKKIGVTNDEAQLPVRESQLRRDAGTIMPFSYVVVAAWKFQQPVAEQVETLLHDLRPPYQGEWIEDCDDYLTEAVRNMLAALGTAAAFANSELDLSTSPDAEIASRVKSKSIKWPALERQLFAKCGTMNFVANNNHAYANGSLVQDGYKVGDHVFASLAQACRELGRSHGYNHGYASCYKAFKTADGTSFEQHLKDFAIL